jgi:threonine dehydrogenase-like Zn-dependent dehydrogenase
MQAVVWKDLKKIEVCDVPRPVPGKTEILVRVKAASLCKTDAAMIEHGILGLEPPVIIGHEVAGIVEELGEGVEGLSAGQLVALDPPVPCRRCRVCQAGLRHMCPNTRHIGAHIPGGLAEYIAIDYRNAHPVPRGLSPEAASLAEPFAVCLEAIGRAGGVRGKTVCVFGDGPFGIILCRLARRQRADQVLLFGHHPARMQQVKEYDVLTFDEQHVDVGRCIREHTDGCGVQVAVDTTGTPQVLDNVVDWLMPRGTLVLFTPPGMPWLIDLDKVHFNEIAIVGSCRSLDLFPEALVAMQEDADRTEALISHRLPIHQVHHGFELMRSRKDDVIKVAIVFDDWFDYQLEPGIA